MRVILSVHCFHFHRLFQRHSILHISISTSHQTSILHLQKSFLAILKVWHISQHQVVPHWFFLVEKRKEMETLLLIMGMFVRKCNVEQVNIEWRELDENILFFMNLSSLSSSRILNVCFPSNLIWFGKFWIILFLVRR